MMLDGLDAQRRGDMGLARAGAADQHDIVGNIDKLATVKLADQRLVDLTAGEVEARQVAIRREPRGLKLIGYRSHFTFGGLRLQKLGQDRDGRIERRRPLFNEIGDSLRHAVHLEAAQHGDEWRRWRGHNAWRFSPRSAS